MRIKRAIVLLITLMLLVMPLECYADVDTDLHIKGTGEQTYIEESNGHLMNSIDSIRISGQGKVYYSLNDLNNAIGMNINYDSELNTLNIDNMIDSKANIYSGDIAQNTSRHDVFAYDMNIKAKGAVVFEDTKDNVIYQKNSHGKLYPASTTKILTAIIALERTNLQDVVTVGNGVKNMPSDSRKANVKTDDRLTMEQLLYGLMLYSGNDCAIAIAEHIGGSVESFAEIMNAKAKELGAMESHFTNPHGYHDSNHYTTAYDLGLITLYASKNEVFNKIVHTPIYRTKITKSDGTTVNRIWKNTNYFIRDNKSYKLDGVVGGKTGYTGKAGYCLVNVANKNGHKYVCVMLKSSVYERYYDTQNIIAKAYALRNEIDKNAYKEMDLKVITPTIYYKGIEIVGNTNLYKYNDEIYSTLEGINKIYAYNLKLEEIEDLSLYIMDKRVKFYRLKPFVHNNIPMIPLNELVDDLDLNMKWDSENNRLIIVSEKGEVLLPLSANKVTINGIEGTVDKKILIGDDLFISIDLIEKMTNKTLRYGSNGILKSNISFNKYIP